MEDPVPIDVLTRGEFRSWLTLNHSSAKECWVRSSHKGPVEGAVYYLDAVEEALCFGWIDSTLKHLSDGTLVQRFSPRRKGSRFSELNKERCRRLERLGLMTEAGRDASPMDEPFIVDADILDRLREDPVVWGNLCSFPDLYVRIRLYNVQTYRGTDRFEPYLERFIESTRRGEIYGEWNDGGRLL